jgi:hypothetical protein
MRYIVLKPIPDTDGLIPSGTIVDDPQWRQLRALVSMRYLQTVPDDYVPAGEDTETKAKRGRPAKTVEESAQPLTAAVTPEISA